MTEQEREFVLGLCSKLEEHFPGVMATFEGFITPWLGGEDDGFLTIEVFNVSEDDMEAVLCLAEDLARTRLAGEGSFITFSLWTPEETQEHFLEDVAAVRRERLSKLVSTVYETLESQVSELAEVSSYFEASFRSFKQMGERLEEVVLSSVRDTVPNWVTIPSDRSDFVVPAYLDVWHDLFCFFDVSAGDELALARREAETASAANESLALAA